MKVTGIRYTPAPEHLHRTGVMGWASFLLDGGVRISGVAVRRTARGTFTLSYPCCDRGFAQRWHYAHPVDDQTRVAIEEQVLAALGLDRELAR